MWGNVLSLFLLCYTLAIVRLCFILPGLQTNFKRSSKPIRVFSASTVMVLLGSGGHTGEMIRILGSVKDLQQVGVFQWIISSEDTTSIHQLTKLVGVLGRETARDEILTLSRARKVGEGLLSSVCSTLKSVLSTVIMLAKLELLPDVFITNGPATAVPLVFILTIFKFFGLKHTKIVYIESLARVSGLSLSGQICYLMSDAFIVQWQKLASSLEHAECYGILV